MKTNTRMDWIKSMLYTVRNVLIKIVNVVTFWHLSQDDFVAICHYTIAANNYWINAFSKVIVFIVDAFLVFC